MAIDLDNRNTQLVIAALAGMVDDEGLTMHQAFERLEEIKRATFSALMQMQREAREASE